MSEGPSDYSYLDSQGRERAEIQQLYGPPVPYMLSNTRVTEAIADRAENVLEKRLEHEIDNALKRGFQ